MITNHQQKYVRHLIKIQVKCLHAHYAHYLATDGDNVVGAMVQEMLDAGEDEDVARAQREEGERRKRDG